MNIIERLISGYPQGDVSPQDFIDHLSIGADGWVGAWGAVGLPVIIGIQIVCFYVGLNLLRFELHDSTMWKFWIFTQVLITIVPGLVMEHRQSRKGFSLWLHIVYICVALVSFNPWCNMWEAIAPDFFSLDANPWYYIMGVVCLFFSVRGLVQYIQLPTKTQ